MNLKKLENKTILIFGKSRAFREEEFLSQMKHHKIDVVKEYKEGIEYVVDGRMMTPYEQNESAMLYETKSLNYISMEVLEKALSVEINEDTLLMSLKLSHDKSRLKDFLQNRVITDGLFFRLLKMYSWGDEDFFENDDNRDVSAAFILRFYENIERNHNVQFATTGFIHLVAQTKNPELLTQIAGLKPLQFHPKISVAIAMSPYSDAKLQEKFFRTHDAKILEALSLNENLQMSLIMELVKDETLVQNIARSVALSTELFELLKKNSFAIALNETLSLQMQEELLAEKSHEMHYALALNDKLDKGIIEKLLQLRNEEIDMAIYENAATPKEILQKAYENEKNHLALSKNESTPIEILYQLQLDARYERNVKINAGFGKHIQTQNIGWL